MATDTVVSQSGDQASITTADIGDAYKVLSDAKSGAIASNEFVCFAAFDGTGNTRHLQGCSGGHPNYRLKRAALSALLVLGGCARVNRIKRRRDESL